MPSLGFAPRRGRVVWPARSSARRRRPSACRCSRRRFQPRQADQRARVAAHRIGDFLDQLLRADRVDGLAHARFLEHRRHRALRLRADLGGARKFGGRREPAPVSRCTSAAWLSSASTCASDSASETAVSPGATSSPLALSIQTSLMLLARMRSISLGSVMTKASAPERVLHPGAAELLEMHADLELVDADFPASARSAAALSVASQVNSGSSRPKWP
jgi:hypothetical protein